MNGGYQVIDFENTTLQTPQTIKGAFEKAKSKKAILCENLFGVTGFLYDSTPNVTDTATLIFNTFVSDAVKIAYITISDEDVVTLVLPE